MAYVSQQRVLEEAGLHQRQLAETPSGSINSANTNFTVEHKPLADNNYDDTITAADVVAYVNGVTVTVSAVNATSGQITLAVAPATGATVTIDYSYSPVAASLVAEVIEEAQDFIDIALEQIVTTPFTTVPKSVRAIARMFAAGLLLTGDYDFQEGDGSITSGNAKLKRAKDWLAAYRLQLADNGEDVGTISAPRSSADRRVFQSFDVTDSTWGPNADENFTVNEVS